MGTICKKRRREKYIMEKAERLKRLKEYVERTRKILDLSSPQVDDIASEEHYRVHLQHSFQKIGQLAKKNNETLHECFFPLLNKDYPPTEEDKEVLQEFSALLIDTTSMENVDVPLIYLQAKRILEHADEVGDLRSQILALDGMIIATYMMVNLTIRLYPALDICFKYRDEGMEAAKRLLVHLEPEKFRQLPDDECRKLVLINSRYIRCLFEWGDKENKEEVNKEDLRLMRRALDIAEDPFYREIMPGYRWDAHIFRTLQYISDFTEYHNNHEFSQQQLEEIYDYTLKLVDFLKEHPELSDGCSEEEQKFYLLRNGFLAGKIPLEEHKAELAKLIRERNPEDFSPRSVFVNFIIPYEFIQTLDKDNLSKEDEETLLRIYSVLASYTYHIPKG